MSIDPSPSKYAAAILADVRPPAEHFECAVLDIDRRKMGEREMRFILERWVQEVQVPKAA